LIQDLDLLPFPSYGNNSFYFIDSGNIKRKDPLFLDSYFWVQSSRGCPYACSYCVNSLLQPLFRNIGPYTRRRSVSNVIKEIRQNLSVSGNTIDRVFFVDEGFGNTENWLNEFELQYKKEIGLPFCVEYNPQNISSMILDKLVNAGLDTISFGIQTGSDYIRNTIFHRPGNNNEIIALARRINSHDVNIKYDLILDNPYDNERSLENTIEFLLQLPRPFFFHLYSLQYFPNYPLTKRAIEDKYIQQGEANMDALIERTTKNWAFVPKVFPYNRKQILQNIIWLIAGNHVKDSIVRYAVFGGDSLIPKLFLNYLNLKAIILGRILGVGGILWRYPLISYFVKGFKYLLKGDFKDFYHKVRKHILYKINSSGSLHPN
jgi:radical SAM superfamily enzyme YgiQ (UPF0313 family)